MPIDQSNARVWVVRLNDHSLTDDLNTVKAQTAVATPMPHLVIDLSGVAMVNSSNLTQLLRLRKLALERDAKIILTQPQGAVRTVFQTTSLDKVFEFAADAAAASRSVGG